ncbi:MAG TPA: 3' terminal RNA ribose 2'-O-methyltransferase Hen1 [Tepidisphaeraceae bacterium]|jgi:3' terminal RNA ribose 2'-O-methyltransferase Hen1|nr:3' terminal RNA ribose 2'-O-methyltransferase Hen1 [Tepidisphaeraceae bacterium]
MLLTLTTTHSPATDLGFLLHKNPARPQSFKLSVGQAHVFYPEADENRCTAALLLDVDPVGLVRNRHGPAGEGFSLEQYVNDRPYAASSFLAVAIAQVFSSALAGTSKDRPALTTTPIPLVARLSVVPCRGGETLLRKLFEPLGYSVTATHHPLDERFAEWGEGPYFTVALSQTITLHDLLTHLYVLIPVLDNDKHYWIGDDEVQKLLRHGDPWLASHPEKEQIVFRYRKHFKHLANDALARLIETDTDDAEAAEEQHRGEEELVEQKISLNEHRLATVLSALRAADAKRVLDLGCSNGNLLRRLLDDKHFEQIVGLDVSHRALEIAAERLHLDRLPERQRQRIQLLHGSLIYRDQRLSGFDAAAVVEVIEHLDEPRLAAFERVLFEFARPSTVIVTTPNVEYNVRFETLPAGQFRHKDHRFEWTRKQFQDWAANVAARFGYELRFLPVGPEDPEVGPATQMAVFTLRPPDKMR